MFSKNVKGKLLQVPATVHQQEKTLRLDAKDVEVAADSVHSEYVKTKTAEITMDKMPSERPDGWMAYFSSAFTRSSQYQPLVDKVEDLMPSSEDNEVRSFSSK